MNQQHQQPKMLSKKKKNLFSYNSRCRSGGEEMKEEKNYILFNGLTIIRRIETGRCAECLILWRDDL